AEWSGLETKGSAIVAYESEDGTKKSLLLPFSIAALNVSDAKELATSTLKWLLENSAVDVKPLEIKYGGKYPLITKELGQFCAAVCVPMWKLLQKAKCEFTNCGSGCGADNVTTFAREDECELARQYYSGGYAGEAGVIVEGKEFNASAIVGSTEKLASPLKVKVLIDRGSRGVSEGAANATEGSDKLYGYSFTTSLAAGEHVLTVTANSNFSINEKNYVNNVHEYNLTVYPKEADLLFRGMVYSYNDTLGSITVNLNVSNLGGTAASSAVKAYLDSKEAASANVELAAGETKQVKLELKSQKGAYNFKAAIDPDNAVAEHNESNNELQQKLYVCSKEKVLVVDDNDAAFFSTAEPSSADEFLNVLRNHGYCAEVWDKKASGTPASSELNKFKAVVWSAGDYFNGTLNSDDAAAIGNFSGELLIEGSDVGLDNADGGLLQGITAAAFSSDMILNDSENESLVLKQHAITANITNISISKEKSPYPDSVDALGAEVVAEWQNGKGAITASNAAGGGGSRKTAYYAFSVDGITDAAVMERLVENTVLWLLKEQNANPQIHNLSNITVGEGENATVTINGTDADGDSLLYSVNDSRFKQSRELNNTFTWQTTHNDSGTYHLMAVVTDGKASASAIANITVADVNVPPELGFPDGVSPAAPTYTLREGDNKTFTILVTDPDNDTLTIRWLLNNTVV
ncbi:MAG: CARDB domain-containing protein, partial [Nanoarchaeota archaeon]